MTWSKLYHPISLIFANLFGSTAVMIACFDYCLRKRGYGVSDTEDCIKGVRDAFDLFDTEAFDPPKWSTFPSAKLTTGFAPSFNRLQRITQADIAPQIGMFDLV